MGLNISVIIVNYNGLKYLRECFDSLYKQLGGLKFEIIVVDNASADDSCIYIKEHYPDIILVESKDNLGFGKANNLGVSIARGEYVLLINNDTIVLNHLAPALEYARQHSDIGAIGINMLDGNQRYLSTCGNFPNVFNMLWFKGLYDLGPEFKQGEFHQRAYDVDWLGGSLLIVPTKIYQEIGGFDEDYFMYVEDVDFSKKLQLHNYRRVFLPGFSYIHFVGFTKDRNPMLITGLKIYINKHSKGILRLQMLGALRINTIIKRIKNLIN